jgi:geranylgeranyl reductase family protein
VTRFSCDVVIVGAGPAGTAAAIALRRAGRSVMIVDKATFPRDKCCGDGLTTLALRELEMLGVEPDRVAGWFDVHAAWLRSPTGREIEVPLPKTGLYAAVAPRRTLDNELVQVARRAGADVHDGHGFSGIDTDDADHVDVDVDGFGSVRCRYVIAADGMWSPVRKALGANIEGYRGEWHAFRQYAGNVTGPAAERLIVWFEQDLLPGYAWSFPLPGNRVNIGFGVLREDGRRVQDMADLWRDLLARPHVVTALGPDAVLEGRHTAWPIPARIDELSLSSGRVLFVGDAAAATDVMTGEGIGQALLTGRLAAEAILTGGALQPDAVRHAYDQAVEHHLFADHRMSKRLGAVLKHRAGAAGAIRIVAASGQWGRRNFARWMFEDEPRAIATSPRRWHRGFLAQPGAYVDR